MQSDCSWLPTVYCKWRRKRQWERPCSIVFCLAFGLKYSQRHEPRCDFVLDVGLGPRQASVGG
eukprot:874676-Amphidinium_carterae.1